jgi:hypothetical protein
MLKLVALDSDILLRLPKSASVKLPSQSTMVEGVINHFPFRAVLEPDDTGSHQLRVSNAVRTAARAEVGDTVTVEITRIGDEPETRVPVDLKKALKAAVKARDAWAKITPMARRDWILSIIVVRQLETREGRIVKTCDMLAAGKGRICCFPGINWLTRDYVTKDETWLPLPKSQR